MTKAQYQRELEKLEREADLKGCCILPSKPLFDPDDEVSHTEPQSNGDEKQTDFLRPNGLRDSDEVSGVSREQIRLSNKKPPRLRDSALKEKGCNHGR